MIDDGRISGFYHSGRGQEATEVAAVMDLRPDDYLLYDHRGCAHMIAKGMDLVSLYGDFLANDLGSTAASVPASCISAIPTVACSARAARSGRAS